MSCAQGLSHPAQIVGLRSNAVFGMSVDEKMYQCPYNESHMVLGEKLASHLVKCRRNHPCEEIGICRFDSSHHVRKMELRFHENLCQAGVILFNDVFLIEGQAQSAFAVSKPDPSSSVEMVMAASEENWEEDDEDDLNRGSRKTYDPKIKLSKQAYLVVPQAKTKAQRKAFRKAQFDLFQGITSDDPPCMVSASKVFTKFTVEESTKDMEKPMRLPRFGPTMPGMPSLLAKAKVSHVEGKGHASPAAVEKEIIVRTFGRGSVRQSNIPPPPGLFGDIEQYQYQSLGVGRGMTIAHYP